MSKSIYGAVRLLSHTGNFQNPPEAIPMVLGASTSTQTIDMNVYELMARLLILRVNSPNALAFGLENVVDIDTENASATPVIVDGRTLVPVRFISERFGYNVDWDAVHGRITLSKAGESTITMHTQGPEVQHIRIGNRSVELDVAPMLIDGRTFVPLRAFVESALGKRIEWVDDNGEQLIIIYDENEISRSMLRGRLDEVSSHAVERLPIHQIEADNYNQMTRSELAQEILDRHYHRSASGRHIIVRQGWGSMTDAARTSPYMNITDTANGLNATRAATSNTGSVVGGTVALSAYLLRAILLINDEFGTVTINSLAGGRHTPTSNHYTGRAVDFQSNGRSQVTGTSPLVRPATIINYLRDTHGFRTQLPTEYVGGPTFFHLDILN